MANSNYTYQVELKESHLSWGDTRYTGSRTLRAGEAYIKNPSKVAYAQDLLNLNGTNGQDIMGKNLFSCTSADGFFSSPGVILRAQGNQADDSYAKQFSVDNNLQTIGDWYAFVNAKVGDVIEVTWITPTHIEIRKI